MIIRLWRVVLLALNPVEVADERYKGLLKVLPIVTAGSVSAMPVFMPQFFIQFVPRYLASLIIIALLLLIAAYKLQKQIDKRSEDMPALTLKGIGISKPRNIFKTRETIIDPTVAELLTNLRNAIGDEGNVSLESLQRARAIISDQFTNLIVANAVFANEPNIKNSKTHARNIVATISFHRPDGSNILNGSINGRWADTDQPESLRLAESKLKLCTITMMSNGLLRTLDLFLKFNGELPCYATDNNNFLNANPAYRIDDTNFEVIVKLQGEGAGTSGEWRFAVRNENSGPPDVKLISRQQ